MSIFKDAQNIAVQGGEINQYNGDYHFHNNPQDKGHRRGLLLAQIAASASYNSDERYDAPKCHPDTRVAILDNIISLARTAHGVCIVWLHGAAGAGKSAIAQSVAERCVQSDKEAAILLGSFFFFRASASRNSAKPLAATLAYQLTQSIPSTTTYVLNCISRDPAIFTTNLENQLTKLLIEPLRSACEDEPALKSQPRLIILDGLDECGEPKEQKMVLTALEKILPISPLPLVVLVASRPENHIQSTFDAIDSRSCLPVVRIGLNDVEQASQDIRLFLENKFSTIRQTHPLRVNLPAKWPTPGEIDIVVAKSSGQFIYAATVVRYVESDRHNPQKRLQTALSATTPRNYAQRDAPFEALDALYTQIFSAVDDENMTVTLAVLFLRLCDKSKYQDGLTQPWELEERLRLELGDVHTYLSPLASLVKYEGNDSDLFVFHASLHDFLFDATRSQQLYADQPAVHSLLCGAYLSHLFDSDLPDAHIYSAMQLCVHHARLADWEIPSFDPNILDESEGRIASLIPRFCAGMQPRIGEAPKMQFHPRFERNQYLQDFVKHLLDFRDVMKDRIDDVGFWNGCISEMHNVFRRDLFQFLSNRPTHDLLALSVFMDDEVGTFPPLAFVRDMGVEAQGWEECAKPRIPSHAIFMGARPRNECGVILRQFLRNQEHAGELYVNEHAFVRVARVCATLVSTANDLVMSAPERSGMFTLGPTSPVNKPIGTLPSRGPGTTQPLRIFSSNNSGMIGPSSFSGQYSSTQPAFGNLENLMYGSRTSTQSTTQIVNVVRVQDRDVRYWWAVRGLTSMLKLAVADDELIQTLRSIDLDRLPCRQHRYVQEAIGAVQTYLEKHSATQELDVGGTSTATIMSRGRRWIPIAISTVICLCAIIIYAFT